MHTQALRYPPFRLFLGGRFLASIAVQVQSVGVAWHIYELTRDPLALGYVGLAQFLPVMFLSLPAGDITDRFDRRWVLAAAQAAQGLSALLLFTLTWAEVTTPWPFYATLVLFGAARAFSSPAGASLLPHLVPIPALTNATSLNSSTFQIAVVVGPAVGGGLLLLGPAMLYAICVGLFALVVVSTYFLPSPPKAAPDATESTAIERVAAGLRFIWRTPLVLGATSLDLFAVLLGGATALMPIFASDILHVGPTGLGLLRSAPALGAAVTGIILAQRSIPRQSGPIMFASVALFGVCTIIFGLSENLYLSLVVLVVMGAADMVSVVVRWTLIQLATPDHMRGRVSAVNFLFVGASNELGEFESGVTARLFGTVPAVVLGGLGTLLVVGIWHWRFPALRKLDRLADVTPAEAKA